MTTFHITGKPTKVSKEEVRTILHATKTVLEFHNLTPANPTVRVYLVPPDHKELINKYNGVTFYPESKIWLNNTMDFDTMMSVTIHECIHAFHSLCGLEEHTEHQTSTLNTKLKPTIALIYETLADGIYKRAGYIAHVKMAYKPGRKDHYNDAENAPEDVHNGAKKYRRKHNLI
jgi:hypothetical protein